MNANDEATAWMARKACVAADVDPEAFFPSDATRATKAATREAKATCARCLVRSECREYARTNDIEFGIWGGEDERERRARRLVTKYPERRPNLPTWDERCGTYAGTKAHRKRNEGFCDECKAAKADYERDRRRRTSAAQREAS